MKCSDFEQLEMKYMDGSISNAEIHELNEHISECESCRKEYEAYSLIMAELPKIQEPVPEEDFTRKVLLTVANLPKPCKGLKFLVLCAVTAAISSVAGVLNLALLNQAELTAALSSNPLTVRLVQLIELLAGADNAIKAFSSRLVMLTGYSIDTLTTPLMLICITMLCIYTLLNTIGGIKNE